MEIGANISAAIGLFTTCGLMILGLLATWPATRAYEKGRSFAKWYIFGVVALPAAIVASYLIRAGGNKKM